MGNIGPIEPLVHVPASNLCFDTRNDAQRRQDFSGDEGLRSLIPGERTPIAASRGVRDGVWTPTGRVGIYLVREELADTTAIEKVRHCWVATLEPSSRLFVPVVAAERELVDHTAREVRRGGVDPTGTVALYRDEDHRLEKLLDSRRGVPPLTSLVDGDGTRTQVWCLSREESGFVAAVLEECGGTIVGDVTLYRSLVKLRDDPTIDAQIRPNVRFYHTRDFGVTFAPTLRFYRGRVDVNGIAETLHRFYQVEEYRIDSREAAAAFVDRVRNDGVTRRAVGLLARTASTAFLVHAPDDAIHLVDYENIPAVAARFDTEWVEKGILRRLSFRDDVPELSRVETDFASLPGGFVGEESLSFVVNPPPKREVASLRTANWRLPVGSLIVRPPIPRGLFLAPLRPASRSTAV